MRFLDKSLQWILLGSFLIPESTSFMALASTRSIGHSKSELPAGWLEDFQNFFDSFRRPDIKSTPTTNEAIFNNAASTSLNDNLPAGTTRIVHIPVQSIKPGGLRLFLMFYLLGKQKSPDGQTIWTAHQPTRDDFVIEYYFHDQSAMLTIELSTQDGVTIDRIGSLPSTAYIIHESSILDGILDELHVMAFDDSVSLENRLLTLCEPQNAIDMARETIAFG
jgi:hypothetical protein